MPRFVFTMASGRNYTTADVDKEEASSLASKLVNNTVRDLFFVVTGKDNVLLNPLQIESVQFFEDGE